MKRLIPLILCLALASCSPRHFEPIIQRDTTYIARVDSVYIVDSIYIDRYRTIETKADTIYVTDIRTEFKYKWRDREVHDTTFVERVVQEIKEVPAQITKLQRLWMTLGKALALIALLYLIIVIVKRRLI